MEEKRIRVLNVEDEEIDHRALMRVVRGKELKYDVDWASSLQQAIKLVQENRYDLVLLDYMMPDGTGLDLLKEIMGVPSIFVTGSGDETVAVKAMKGGAYDYLIKDPSGSHLELLPTVIDRALQTFRLMQDKKRAEEELKEKLEAEKRLNKILLQREFRIKELNDEVKRLKERIRELEGSSSTSPSS